MDKVLRGDEGATSSEYALLAAFVAVAVAVAVLLFGEAVLGLFVSANETLR
ncbi:hypothetical protein [Micromonospora cathayae]|uniref:Flp family type IVb pilin n=1 Tax=Micromonospora cathayae TaxID=3028804 RepID=A0ABY7ZU92_9ACTN|nr:hypothetical protein [Micromonospora sp. HUAS 3]WDZ85598.1 hypothetical protein PVK37_03855 [Micromonospora sp. HUAS 3]